MAYSLVGEIGRFQWDIAVTRIGQLASEMKLSTGGQSVGGSNGNAGKTDISYFIYEKVNSGSIISTFVLDN